LFSVFNEKDTKKRRSENAAVDKGGPTRAFFSEFWQQMSDISAMYDDHKIRLFQSSKAGPVPVSDEKLEIMVRKAALRYDGDRAKREMEAKIFEKVDGYYRAVGLIMFRSIMSRNPIASHALPRFFLNGKNLYVHVIIYSFACWKQLTSSFCMG